MLGGILDQAGYFMGRDLSPPGIDSNPQGFFESPDINGLNERILQRFDRHPTVYAGGRLGQTLAGALGLRRRLNPGKGQRWLCSLSPEVAILDADEGIQQDIRALVAQAPFAFKDPRFSYTLPVWEPFLPADTVLLCVFRHPAVTVRSIIKEVGTRRYLRHLRMNETIAYQVYENVYSHVFQHHARRPEPFVFVHYDQIFDGSALRSLSQRLQVDLDADFVEPSLRRTRKEGEVPAAVRSVYQRLCDLAGYREG